jgi:STE24 endopeptidase
VNEDKATRYHRLRRRAELGGAAAAAALLVLLIVTNAGHRLRELAAAVSMWQPFGIEETLTVAAMTTMMVILLQLVEAPFAFYLGYRLEHRYGLSTQSMRQWLKDQVKGTMVAVVLMVLGASVVYYALRTWPGVWWVLSSAVFTVAMVGLVQLAPVVLLPIFYSFRPIERPELVERLLVLARRARTRVGGVFEWALSTHTRKANAALAGLGRTRRILLSDTLLAEYSDDEIEVVLAHELAHHVHGDLWRGMAAQTVSMVAGFFVADLLLRRLADWAGLRGLADPAGLPLLLLIAGAWSFLAMPPMNALSRLHERRADRYALEATRNAEAFISAMKRLSQQNLAEERPSRLVRWLFYSHPPIRERIEAARAFAPRVTPS